MKVIGVIGGCGSGKSEVTSLFQHKFGAYVINADKIGHQVIKKGTKTYTRIIEHFGKEILDNSGEINRRKLGAIVFDNKMKLDQLISLTHPAINDIICQTVEKLRDDGLVKLVIIEITAPGEGGIYPLIDEYWYVYCELETRYERLAKYRNMPRDKATDIMSKQLSDEQFREYADEVIDNSLTVDHTYKQMLNIMSKKET